MANSDKNIVITPNIGQAADPSIVFSGADATTGPQNITLQVYPTDSGTLSFEGSAGQLFSITNSLTGTIFSVNDVSGIPSFEVNSDGTVKIAEYNGRVLFGTGVDNGTDKLQINGDVLATTFKGPLTGNATTATTLQTTRAINGTNFNGSAAITTVNWGTARTLTIGLSGKSVNGSANVSWTLAEIGAYAATNPNGYTSNTGTVTSIATNNGLIGGTITTSGTLGLTGQALALHNLATNGMIARTAAGTVAARTITAGTGITLSNGNGVSGNPTITNSAPHIGTNLGITAGTTAGPIVTSSTGTNATLPTASGTASGVVTTGAQTWAGVKTFSSTITGSISGNAGTVTNGVYITGDQVIAGVKSFNNFIKLLPDASIFTIGSGNTSHRTVKRACEFRSSSSGAVGAFVIKAPTTGTVMHQFRVRGMIYDSGVILDTVVQVYRTGTNITANTRVIHYGTLEPTIRTGRDAADRFCLIIGTEAQSWSYPHIIVDSIMTSHSNASDAYASGWTITQETSLSTFLAVSAAFTVISGVPRATRADTFTTARTINGTSFDGSANITTANWGTARTINGSSINGSANVTTANWGTARTLTIGATGKSVNGSANVAWTLAEIGAQKKVVIQDAAPTGVASDLWWDSDAGTLNIYYGSAWVEVNPSLGTGSNPRFNSLGIGTNASGTAGEIRATADITAYFSDERLKNFEGKINNSLEKIHRLNGYYFKQNEVARNLGYVNENRQVGVSAQEVQSVLPEIVKPAPIDDTYLTVQYEKLAPLFIEAIKELDTKYQNIINELREEINLLKGKK